MVLSGSQVGNQVVEAIQREAEINVYLDENLDNNDALQLVEQIKSIESVREARMINEDEAYGRMAEILGKDARVMEHFDDNPFDSFIEVKINLQKIDSVLEELNLLKGIEHIRDNREVLDRLRNISEVSKILGYLIVAAVGISTLVIISHIIRLGIYNNKDQINTLRLLGAPESFIAFPFFMEGLVLTLGGGILASGLASFTIKKIYTKMTGPLPFIPMPPREELVSSIVILVIVLSSIIGIVGSMLGLSSSRNK